MNINIYNDLSKYSFISNDINNSNFKKPISLSKEKLISLTKALSEIKRYGYEIVDLSLDNLLFYKDTLYRIISLDKAKIGSPINDFLYVIDSYIDLEEEYYSNDYAIDLILTIASVYDKYTEELDLGYELYWYFINKINNSPKDSDIYNKYDNKLRFVIKYKPYLDELHQEEI